VPLRGADFGSGGLRRIDRHGVDCRAERRRAGAGARAASVPAETALGSLCRYISSADTGNYQPANITFDLLPPLEEETRHRLRHDRRARHAEVCRRALVALESQLA